MKEDKKEELILMIQSLVSKHTREVDRVTSNFERDLLDLSTELADGLIDIQMKIMEEG